MSCPDLSIFIGLFISSAKISRYCYKSAILPCIYAQNSVVMHQLCIRHGNSYPPMGYIGWHNGAGVTPTTIRKQKKALILSAMRRQGRCAAKFSGNGNDTLLPQKPSDTNGLRVLATVATVFSINFFRCTYLEKVFCNFTVATVATVYFMYLFTLKTPKKKKNKEI